MSLPFAPPVDFLGLSAPSALAVWRCPRCALLLLNLFRPCSLLGVGCLAPMPAPSFSYCPLRLEDNRQRFGLAPAALRGGLVARFSTAGRLLLQVKRYISIGWCRKSSPRKCRKSSLITTQVRRNPQKFGESRKCRKSSLITSHNHRLINRLWIKRGRGVGRWSGGVSAGSRGSSPAQCGCPREGSPFSGRDRQAEPFSGRRGHSDRNF